MTRIFLGQIRRRISQYIWLTVPLLAIPALWPFYQEGLPRSFDGGLHLLRLGALDRQLRLGVLYPRWMPDLLLGYGYPLFNYYAPSTYYLAEALHLLGLSFYSAFIATFALLILAAAFGMFLLAADILQSKQQPQQRWAALIAAIAYLYGPYLLTNVYIRGALAEVGAQALLPWILWSARRLFHARQPAPYALLLVLGLGGLAITHNITLLFFPPVLLGYMAIHWWRAGRSKNRLGWAIFSLGMAMAISAFFWLPLLVERRYLANTAYEISRSVWLPASVWTWQNFLDSGFAFQHSFARPIRLGLVQLILAVSGYFLARRGDVEWLFFLAIALISALGISAWSLPLWLNNELLSVAQFTWRLLAILSLPLALFAGGIVVRIPTQWAQSVAAVAVIALVILANQPRLAWMDVFSSSSVDVTPPLFAQTEIEKGVITGGEGNSSIQEFRPRWVDRSLVLDSPSSPTDIPAFDLELLWQNAHGMGTVVKSADPIPLRFSNFYFPGWRVRLDGHTQLAPYPSTNLGLLTVDVPAGEHELAVEWKGTALQRGAGAASLIALAILAWIGWRRGVRLLALFTCMLLAYGIAATVWPSKSEPILAPTQPVEASGMRLLGYRLAQTDVDQLYLYPYWLITSAPSDDLRLRWQLATPDGQPVTELTSYPYFNTSRAANWASGTLIDDAYRLPLAPGMPAGSYQLSVRMGETQAELAQPALQIGTITLSQPIPTQELPDTMLDVRYGDSVRLAGFDTLRNNRTMASEIAASFKPPLVQSGDYVEYRLYWRATAPIDQNYHGFVHLVNNTGQPLVQQDQLPGPFFAPPSTWDQYRLNTDNYLLRIPHDAPSGLYWPNVGMYEFETLDRLSVYADPSAQPSDTYRLPPIKLWSKAAPRPEQARTVRFGDVATLLGYDLALPPSGLLPGDSFTITLYFRSDQATDVDYVRFLQLYAPGKTMAAQQDSPPQAGNNPTWSWVTGETILDTVTLHIAEDAEPGDYRLFTGFYDVQANGVRLAVEDEAGQSLPDGGVVLETLHVGSK